MEDQHAKRVVVVVGGGVGGALLAKELQFDADIYLIDPKEYFEIPWANLRAMVEPSIAERTLVKHTDYLTNGRIVTSQAVGVTDKEVLTVDGRTIAYDYLVIATGRVNTIPRSRRDRMEQFQQDNHMIKSSSSVLIIGGGPTGVELAGEIAVDYPEKKVTLVHRGSRLLEFIGPKASQKALDWLTLKKVDVLLGQTVDLDSMCENERVYTTSGIHLKGMLGQQRTTDENLRVGGRNNIFAIGDITDIPEIKQGYLAQKHAWVVVKNLKLLIKGTKENKLEKYKPSSSAIATVSLGRKEAIAELPFATISGCLPGFIKSRDLFVGKTRKEMGLDPHPH